MNAIELNEKIVEKIKSARNEREFSQKKIADELNKTSAAISDMERGKVMVSASELYIIAKLLDKPIEYFYGEDFGGKDAQDIIAVTRLNDPEAQANTVEIVKMIMQLNSISKKVSKYKKGEDVPNKLVVEFYETFVPFSQAINSMAQTMTQLQEFFDKELKIRGIKSGGKK